MRGQQHDLVEQRRAQMLLDGVENGDIHARLLRAGRAGVQPREKPRATGQHVVVRDVELACVPRIGHVTRGIGELEQLEAAAIRSPSQLATHIAHVRLVHAYEQVPFVSIGAAQATGGLAGAIDALRFQHGAGAVMHGASDLVVVRGCRPDDEGVGHASARDEILHHELSHG